MAGLIREFYNLILNGRAVTRAGSLNRAGKQRGTVQIIADDLMRFLVGIGQPAGNLLLLHRLRIRRKGKRNYTLISKLLFHLGEINAAAVCPGRSSGLEAEHFNSVCNQGIRQMIGRLQAIRAGGIADITVDAACL